MYGIWHGPEGLKKIATRINHFAQILHRTLSELGFDVKSKEDEIFDTITLEYDDIDKMKAKFEEHAINLRYVREKNLV